MVFALNMEAEITAQKSVAPPQKRRAPGTLLLITAGFILIIAVAFWMFATPRNANLTWLNPSDVMNPPPPGALTKMKNQVLRTIDPVWRHFRPTKPQVSAEIGILTVTSGAAESAQLGAPASTNANGMRAWIVSHEQLNAFNQFLKTNEGVTRIGSPRIATGDGRQSQISVGQSIFARNPSGTNWIPVGITVNMVAKLRGDSFSVTVGAICSDVVRASAPVSPDIHTKFAAACRALIPNSGGLIVDGGSGTNAGGTNYWFTISPTAIDARGVLIKLR